MKSTNYLLSLINPLGHFKADNSSLSKLLSVLYNKQNVYITKNGRSALYLFLKSLNLPKGSEILVQAFTCRAVIDPIIQLGLKPVYVDIMEEDFSMNPKVLRGLAHPQRKILIVQHTFGLSANASVFDFCRSNSILVIEDCAHTLGNPNLGVKGDAMFLSFGFEKMLKTRVGGALIVNNNELKNNIEKEYSQVKKIGFFESVKWGLNPIFWRLIRTLNSRFLVQTLSKLNLLDRGFEMEDMSKVKTLTTFLSNIIIDSLQELEDIITHRTSISNIYSSILNTPYYGSLLRYPYIAKDSQYADELTKYLSSLGFSMEDRWYQPVVFPRSVNLAKMQYIPGSCPNAEEISSRIVNLPTGLNVTEEMAKNIAEYIVSKA